MGCAVTMLENVLYKSIEHGYAGLFICRIGVFDKQGMGESRMAVVVYIDG